MARKKNYSEKIVNAVLENDKVVDIMSAPGLSRSTIERYRADPELQRILSERKAAFIEAAVLKMQKTLSESADVLQRIIKNEEINPQTRVNAIQVLFTQCRNWTETADILKRLEALEMEECRILIEKE